MNSHKERKLPFLKIFRFPNPTTHNLQLSINSHTSYTSCKRWCAFKSAPKRIYRPRFVLASHQCTVCISTAKLALALHALHISERDACRPKQLAPCPLLLQFRTAGQAGRWKLVDAMALPFIEAPGVGQWRCSWWTVRWRRSSSQRSALRLRWV